MDAIPNVHESSFTLVLPIDTVEGDLFVQTELLLPSSSKYASSCKEHGDGRPILRYLDREKLDGSSYAYLPLTITPSSLTIILVDDEISCSMIYLEILTRLGLRLQYLKSCQDQTLLAFNNASTHPCKQIYLPITRGKWDERRMVNVFFLVIPCKTVYNDILGRPHLAVLDTIAYLIHLRLKYHDESGLHV